MYDWDTLYKGLSAGSKAYNSLPESPEEEALKNAPRSVFDRFIDVMQVGQYPIQGAIRGMIDKDVGVIEGIAKGLRAANPFGKDYKEGEYTFSDNLSEAGWNPQSKLGKTAKWGIGLAGDIMLDPLTYVSGGASAVAKGSGKTLTKGAAKAMTRETAEGIVKKTYDDIFEATGKKMSKETFEHDVKKVMQTYDKGNNVVEQGKNVQFSLGNAPFGKKIFGKNADKTIDLFDDKVLRDLGDKTKIAPALNSAREAFYGGKMGTKFSTKTPLYRLAQSDPEKMFKFMKTVDTIKGMDMEKIQLQELVRKRSEQFGLKLTPDEQTEVLELLEDKTVWAPIKKEMLKFDSEVFQKAKSKLQTKVQKFDKNIESLEKTLDDLEKQISQFDKIDEVVETGSKIEPKTIQTPAQKESKVIDDIVKFENAYQKEMAGLQKMKIELEHLEVSTKTNAKIQELEERIAKGRKMYKEKYKVALKQAQEKEYHDLLSHANKRLLNEEIALRNKYPAKDLKKLTERRDELVAQSRKNKEVATAKLHDELEKSLSDLQTNYSNGKLVDKHEFTAAKASKKEAEKRLAMYEERLQSMENIWTQLQNTKKLHGLTSKEYFAIRDKIVKKGFDMSTFSKDIEETRKMIKNVKGSVKQYNKYFKKNAKATFGSYIDDMAELNQKYYQLHDDIEKNGKLFLSEEELLEHKEANKKLNEVIEKMKEFKQRRTNTMYALKNDADKKKYVYNMIKKEINIHKNKVKFSMPKKEFDDLVNKEVDRIIKGTRKHAIDSTYSVEKDKLEALIQKHNDLIQYGQTLFPEFEKTSKALGTKELITLNKKRGMLSSLKKTINKGTKELDASKELISRAKINVYSKHMKYEDAVKYHQLQSIEDSIAAKGENISIPELWAKRNKAVGLNEVIEKQNSQDLLSDIENLKKGNTPLSNKEIDKILDREKGAKRIEMDSRHAYKDNYNGFGSKGDSSSLLFHEVDDIGEKIDADDIPDWRIEGDWKATQKEIADDMKVRKANRDEWKADMPKVQEFNKAVDKKTMAEVISPELRAWQKQIQSLEKELKDLTPTVEKISSLSDDIKVKTKQVQKAKKNLDNAQSKLKEIQSNTVENTTKLNTINDDLVKLKEKKAVAQKDYDYFLSESEKIHKALESDEATLSYMGYHLKGNKFDKLKKGMAHSETVFKLETLDLEDNVKNIAKNIKEQFDTMAKNEQMWGKLTEEQIMEVGYAPHILTNEGGEFFRSKRLKGLIEKGDVYIDELGFGKVFNPHSKSRTIKKILLDGKMIENPTIRQINDYFKQFTDGKNVMCDNLVDLYMARGFKNLELMYDDQYMEEIMHLAGRSFDGILDAGNKVCCNVGQLKKYVSKLSSANHKQTGEAIEDLTKKYLDKIGMKAEQLDNPSEIFMNLDIDQANKIKSMFPHVDVKQVSEELYGKVNESVMMQTQKNNSEFLKMFDKFTHLWKLNVTTILPSFHVRNAASNTFNTWLAVGNDALNPKLKKKAFDLVRSGGKTSADDMLEIITKDGTRDAMSWGEMFELAKSKGVLDEGFFSKDLGAEASTKGFLNQYINPKYNPTDSENFIPYEVGAKVGGTIENSDRFLLFASQIRNGVSVDDAVSKVNKYLFDYGDLTPFEQTTMKRIIPFYTWLRKNAPLQVEQMFEQPEKYRLALKIINSPETTVEEEDRVHKELMADFAQDWVQLPFNVTNPDGRKEPMLWNPNLPYSDISRIPNPMKPVESAKGIISQMNPLIKTPLELAMNKHFYYDRPIAKEGENKTLKGADHILEQLGGYNQMKDVIQKDGADKAMQIISSLTGVKTASYDYDKYKQYKIKEILDKYK